jgi:hypothetical protein
MATQEAVGSFLIVALCRQRLAVGADLNPFETVRGAKNNRTDAGLYGTSSCGA